jgi:hypothetical protein
MTYENNMTRLFKIMNHYIHESHHHTYFLISEKRLSDESIKLTHWLITVTLCVS